jgi:hypothetical protein
MDMRAFPTNEERSREPDGAVVRTVTFAKLPDVGHKKAGSEIVSLNRRVYGADGSHIYRIIYCFCCLLVLVFKPLTHDRTRFAAG